MNPISPNAPAFSSQSLWRTLEQYLPVKRWLVGFSGGLDSTALLAALLAARPEQPIVAIHVNHGLSDNAEDWQRHCLSVCREWQVECRVETVRVQSTGYGLEDAARNARYRAFDSHLEEGDVLLLGHHRDDQAETLLFRLMRGAGPRGMGSIVAQRRLGLGGRGPGGTGPGRLVRPLLKVGKFELESFAREAGLDWIGDESNSDEAFDRNFLRQRVLPLLAERWPTFPERLGLTAEACQEADQLNQDLGRIDLDRCGEQPERWGWSVDWQCLLRLPAYRRNNLLRSWALLRGLPVMQRKHLQEADKQFFAAEVLGLAVSEAEVSQSKVSEPTVSGQSLLQWANAALRYYRGRIYLMPSLPARQIADNAMEWSPESELLLPDGGLVSARVGMGGLQIPEGPVEVRWRHEGVRCQPAERGHSQSLKKLFQEYRLEPWLRDRIPLIYVGGRLAAVGDLWICKGFTAPQTLGYQLEWRLLSR